MDFKTTFMKAILLFVDSLIEQFAASCSHMETSITCIGVLNPQFALWLGMHYCLILIFSAGFYVIHNSKAYGFVFQCSGSIKVRNKLVKSLIPALCPEASSIMRNILLVYLCVVFLKSCVILDVRKKKIIPQDVLKGFVLQIAQDSQCSDEVS
uniref:Uncharacterized protein n=1 Tax=Oryza barthii TaxID=65489 RepID=A0A0D3GI27_9ORYZ